MAARSPHLLLCGILLATAATARAEPRPYRGPHPLDHGGEWHLEGSVHVHDELAVGLAPFGEVDGVLVFLGDPVEYGFSGSVWTYRGIHPLPARFGGYCGVEGEHRHPFAPEGEFRQEGEVYVYTGALRGDVPTAHPGRLAPPRGARTPSPPVEPDYVAPVLWWATPVHPGTAHVHPSHAHAPHAHPHAARAPTRRRPPPARSCTSLTGRASISGGCPTVGTEPPPGPPPRPRPVIRSGTAPRSASPPARRRPAAPGEDPF